MDCDILKKRLKDKAVPTLELNEAPMMNIELIEIREESLDVVDVESDKLIISNALPLDVSPIIQYCKSQATSSASTIRRSSLDTPQSENMISSSNFDRLISIPTVAISQDTMIFPPSLNASLSENKPLSQPVDHFPSLPTMPLNKITMPPPEVDQISNSLLPVSSGHRFLEHLVLEKVHSSKEKVNKDLPLNNLDLTSKGKKAYAEIMKLWEDLWRYRKQ